MASYICGGFCVWWAAFAVMERSFPCSNLRPALELSGITTASLGAVRLLGTLTPSPDISLNRSLQYLWSPVIILLSVGTFGFALLYVLARVYLVVESFLNLAYLPDSVFATPNFALYFPHLG